MEHKLTDTPRKIHAVTPRYLVSCALSLLGNSVAGIILPLVLLGFFVFDRIPEAKRGSALGTQNSLMLVAAPIAVFASSVVVELFGEQHASLCLGVCWIIITLIALVPPA